MEIIQMGWFSRGKAPKPEGAIPTYSRMPDDTWSKCPQCSGILFTKELRESLGVCMKCKYHFRLPAKERIEILLDKGTFIECEAGVKSGDPLGFRDVKRYRDRIKAAEKKNSASEAVVVGSGQVCAIPVNVGVFDFGFMGGSMGSAVGEKLARIAEKALTEKTPLIFVSASGGARMQEGLFSLMQMAKVSVVLGRLSEAGLPYLSILTDPTTGGVAASFAMQGDVILAEPKAEIGFAGRRVIQQTIRQQLPAGFQRSEFLLQHGMIDRIVPRSELRTEVGLILRNFGF